MELISSSERLEVIRSSGFLALYMKRRQYANTRRALERDENGPVSSVMFWDAGKVWLVAPCFFSSLRGSAGIFEMLHLIEGQYSLSSFRNFGPCHQRLEVANTDGEKPRDTISAGLSLEGTCCQIQP